MAERPDIDRFRTFGPDERRSDAPREWRALRHDLRRVQRELEVSHEGAEQLQEERERCSNS